MNKVVKFLAYDGRVNVICTNTTELVEEIRKIHDLTPVTTAGLGRLATISGMMGFTYIKEDDDHITIQLNGRGPMGALVSVIKRKNKTTKIKVYTDNPHVDLPLKSNGKLDVGTAVGKNGFLNIINKNEKFLKQNYELCKDAILDLGRLIYRCVNESEIIEHETKLTKEEIDDIDDSLKQTFDRLLENSQKNIIDKICLAIQKIKLIKYETLNEEFDKYKAV